MRMKDYALFLTATVFLLLFTAAAQADEKNRIKLAKEFMALTDVPQMMEKVFEGVRGSELNKLKEVVYPGKMPETDEVLLKRVTDYLDKTLTWGNFEEGYAGVYSAFFTEEELGKLVEFYSSPVAKKLQGSDRELKIKLLESTQMQMRDMALTIKKIENEFIAEHGKEKKND
jgi:hypothetical protein